MRIAYFTNQYPKVSHSFIRREILALEKQGVEVCRFALRGWDAEVVDDDDVKEKHKTQYLLQNGLFGLLLPTLKSFLRSPFKFLSTLKLAIRIGWRADRPLSYHLVYFAEACSLLGRLKTLSTIHVHAHFGTNATEVVMLARNLGGPPYSFTVHGPEEFDKPVALYLGEKIKHSKFVVAISSYGRSQLFRCVPYEYWPKIMEVHCGLETSFYDVPVTPISDTNRLVCIGRICEQKGQLILVDALRLLSERGVPCELILAGDGEMRSEVEQLVTKFNLKDKVSITGWISSKQVREIIFESRALVLPSFAEGLPVVIMEAMALRRPVLSTYVAGIPELVVDGENGWLFPAGSVEMLASAMEECLKTPVDVLNEMGNTGFRKVSKHHDIGTETKKLTKLFSSSLQNP